MFLQNFYNLVAANHIGTSSDTTEKIKVVRVTSETLTPRGGILDNQAAMLEFSPDAGIRTSLTGTSSTSQGLVLGTGTSAPTLGDYTLSGDVITGISTLSTTGDYSVTNAGITLTKNYVIQNDTDTDITATEYGLLIGIKSSSSSSNYPVMVYRGLLENALVIPAGGTATLVYSFTYDYPKG